MPRTDLRRLVVVLAVAGLALVACSGPTPAASVGETSITDEELAEGADLFRFLAAVNQQPCGVVEPGSGDTDEAACNRFALSNLIRFEVARSYAATNDVAVDEAELDDVMQRLEEQLGAEELDRLLADNEVTRADLRELARDFALVRDVATDVAADEVGEQGLRDRYDADIGTYTIVQVDHILVETRTEAQDVYDEVSAPGATRDDFLALAGDLSIDPSAEQNSGSLGSAVASTYVAEFADAALALEPGAISEPVQTQFGWHVIRLEDKEVTPFSEAKADIVLAAAQDVFPGWLRGQLEDLEVNPKYGRYDLETLTVQRISSTDPDAPTDATPVPASP